MVGIGHRKRRAIAIFAVTGVLNSTGCATDLARDEPNTLHTSKLAEERTSALDRKLEELVQELGRATALDTSDELDKLQLRWKQLVRDECSWEARLGGRGSVAPLVYSSCMERMLKARIGHLKPLLCEGGGMTGSCAASERY